MNQKPLRELSRTIRALTLFSMISAGLVIGAVVVAALAGAVWCWQHAMA